MHEPQPGKYNFDGDADLLSFIQLVDETGLLLVLRPGMCLTHLHACEAESEVYVINKAMHKLRL